MRVELPWPDPTLAPNRRNGKHWTVTHTAKLSAFGDAATLTMQALRATGYQAPADGPPQQRGEQQDDRRDAAQPPVLLEVTVRDAPPR